MTGEDPEVIDHTVMLTRAWVDELANRLGWTDRRRALHLLRSTLTTVRDLLAHDEAAHLAAQLPALLRGFYYEGWRPSGTPRPDRHADSFVRTVEAELRSFAEYRGVADIRMVFRLLNDRISPGEVEDVRRALPEAIRQLWPAPAREPAAGQDAECDP